MKNERIVVCIVAIRTLLFICLDLSCVTKLFGQVDDDSPDEKGTVTFKGGARDWTSGAATVMRSSSEVMVRVLPIRRPDDTSRQRKVSNGRHRVRGHNPVASNCTLYDLTCLACARMLEREYHAFVPPPAFP